MFKIRKIFYRPWPVTVVRKDSDESGNITETTSKFIAHFSGFSEESLDAAVKASIAAHPFEDKGGEVPIAVLLRRNAALFATLIEGWGKEVTDENGKPLPFSREALADMITGPDGLAISTGINRAIAEIRFGIAPQKNGQTSLAPGQAPGADEGEMTSL